MGPGGRSGGGGGGGMISRSAHSEEKHPLADVINLDSDTALLCSISVSERDNILLCCSISVSDRDTILLCCSITVSLTQTETLHYFVAVLKYL